MTLQERSVPCGGDIAAANSAFVEQLRAHLAECGERSSCVSAVHFKVDDVEALIERDGRLAVNGLVIYISQVLSELAGHHHLMARSPWGHFFVVLPDVALKGAIEFAERARLRLAHYRTDATVSVGVVQTGPGDLLEPAELVDAAFELAYEAESLAGGGNLACSTY